MTDPTTHPNSTLRPLDVALLCCLVAVAGGGLLLLAAPESSHLMEGAIEWHEESVLRAVVKLLCLNYEVPTLWPDVVKFYLLGLGSGLAVVALGLAVAVRAREVEPVDEFDADGPATDSSSSTAMVRIRRGLARSQLSPVRAAQLLVLSYLLWSCASSRWSDAADLAVGGSVILAIPMIWALALGAGLRSAAVRVAVRLMIVTATVASAVAVWYHHGRNPLLRAMFPFGNPTLLSACLLPGLLLAVCLSIERIGSWRARRAKSVPGLLALVGAIALCLWALWLADARGSWVGLVYGLLAVGVLAVRGRRRLIPVVLALAIAVGGAMLVQARAAGPSRTGRDATIRLRMYAWEYAWRLFRERPLTGQGQAGFVAKGDSFASEDVQDDPLVFTARIGHVHNEWLEVLCDLGVIGFVLLVGGLVITLGAGAQYAANAPTPGNKWIVIGLLASLVGMMVEETFGVGLRIYGVANQFYTVLGLTWATCCGDRRWMHDMAKSPSRRSLMGILLAATGLAALVANQQNWAGARKAYDAYDALGNGRFDDAIAAAEASSTQFDPQRQLTNLYLIANAQLQAAEKLQHSAFDRERRSNDGEKPDERLLALAARDYTMSDEHCNAGSRALKLLVQHSPAFFNHGWLEYQLNLVQAQNAEAWARLLAKEAGPVSKAGDAVAARDRFVRNAAASIARELVRQPFHPDIAAALVRVAGRNVSFDETLDVLARPLRHHRISTAQLDLLRDLARDAGFVAAMPAAADDAVRSVQAGALSDDRAPMPWAPERLRLAAAVYYLAGDTARALTLLEHAVAVYDRLAPRAPVGAASFFHELAHLRFHADPIHPARAIDAAHRSIEIAPESSEGRSLQGSARLALVDYHIANGDEDNAMNLLRRTGPRHASDEQVLSQLGLHYQQLCSVLVARWGTFSELQRSALLPHMWRWINRATQIDDRNPLTDSTSARIALAADDPKLFEVYVRSAHEKGAPRDRLQELVEEAMRKFPQDESLKALLPAPPP